jgi:hypothetical protein
MAINLIVELGEHALSRADQQNFEFMLSNQIGALVNRLSSHSEIPINIDITFINDYSNDTLDQTHCTLPGTP